MEPREPKGKLGAETRDRQPAERLVDTLYEGRPQRLLNAGESSGHFMLPLLRRLPSAEILVLNMSEEKLRALNAESDFAGAQGRVRALISGGEASADHIPLDDGAVDVVFMANRYHALKDPSAYLREIRRVLRPGGRFVAVDWDPSSEARSAPPRDVRVAASDAEEALLLAGFNETQRRDLYEDFWTVVAWVPELSD